MILGVGRSGSSNALVRHTANVSLAERQGFPRKNARNTVLSDIAVNDASRGFRLLDGQADRLNLPSSCSAVLRVATQ